jgi:hypothetical protein
MIDLTDDLQTIIVYHLLKLKISGIQNEKNIYRRE